MRFSELLGDALKSSATLLRLGRQCAINKKEFIPRTEKDSKHSLFSQNQTNQCK